MGTRGNGGIGKLNKAKEPDLQNLEDEPFRQRKEQILSHASGSLEVSSSSKIQRIMCQAFLFFLVALRGMKDPSSPTRD